jgi:hypothetical protein
MRTLALLIIIMREEILSINNYHERRTLVLIIIIMRDENLSINNNYFEKGEH